MKSPRTRAPGVLEREILETLSAGDLAYGFLFSARSTRRMYRLARERAAYRYRQKQALERLVQKGFIAKRGDQLSLTNSGKTALDQLVVTTKNLLSGTAWDGKWRIVTFDIPETHAGLRRQVRALLQRAGFLQLQKSVWIFPYDCVELAALIKKESKLGPYILYGVLERIEESEKIKRQFHL